MTNNDGLYGGDCRPVNQVEATLPSVAGAIARLIANAPAGGVFTEAQVVAQAALHRGFANETRRFNVHTQGRAFEVTVQEIRL